MKGLIFEPLSRATAVTPNRNDVACFVGLSSMRENVYPQWVERWLVEPVWRTRESGELIPPPWLNLPIPLNSWEQFDELFAWDERTYTADTPGATYLGAAVRSFFAQGGRKCFVISLGDPLPHDADRTSRDEKLQELVPPKLSLPTDRQQYSGIQHLLALPEVSMLALPDLAELATNPMERETSPVELAVSEPAFVECSESTPVDVAENRVAYLSAPECDDEALQVWHTVIRRTTQWLAAERRDVQLIAGFPQLSQEGIAARNILTYLHQKSWLTGTLEDSKSVASAFLQIAYPWLQMGYAGDLPSNLEPPEGVMAGVLARNALLCGSYRSITALSLHDAIEIRPQLAQSMTHAVSPNASPQGSPKSPLIDRFSLLGHTPNGIRWLSDVTTSNHYTHRQGAVNRIIALVLRVARHTGEEFVFESSGERLWQQVEQRLSTMLSALYRAGALRGAQPQDAFQVRCNRSTHTQHQIDNGRLVVQVMIQPSVSIETIAIELSIGDGGRVSLSSLGREAA